MSSQPPDVLSGEPTNIRTIHISCRSCHHYHDRTETEFPGNNATYIEIKCEHCNFPMLGIGGSSMHGSLVSQRTIDLGQAETNPPNGTNPRCCTNQQLVHNISMVQPTFRSEMRGLAENPLDSDEFVLPPDVPSEPDAQRFPPNRIQSTIETSDSQTNRMSQSKRHSKHSETNLQSTLMSSPHDLHPESPERTRRSPRPVLQREHGKPERQMQPRFRTFLLKKFARVLRCDVDINPRDGLPKTRRSRQPSSRKKDHDTADDHGLLQGPLCKTLDTDPNSIQASSENENQAQVNAIRAQSCQTEIQRIRREKTAKARHNLICVCSPSCDCRIQDSSLVEPGSRTSLSDLPTSLAVVPGDRTRTLHEIQHVGGGFNSSLEIPSPNELSIRRVSALSQATTAVVREQNSNGDGLNGDSVFSILGQSGNAPPVRNDFRTQNMGQDLETQHNN